MSDNLSNEKKKSKKVEKRRLESDSSSDEGMEDKTSSKKSKPAGKKMRNDDSEKAEKRRAETNSSSDEGVEDKTPIRKSKSSGNKVKNADGDEMIEIGNMRYVTVRNFRGKALIDIREYYSDKSTGEIRPGKKGISLSREQYQNFKAVLDEIDKKL
ncbi:hypothetical protein KIN20_008582 [Parelaphostrongylus tenuis]|uniref:Transcriptional coactivator p15 (PC4) C-terminal domain-containing protein n=1 Tax=Parelaphostrongylus tenuis TaxID=148309 RepID=A0AAD5M850_PARTN|nr:hypothetical protein KIN20_008582 [Parelaphostrongylus tenuis]